MSNAISFALAGGVGGLLTATSLVAFFFIAADPAISPATNPQAAASMAVEPTEARIVLAQFGGSDDAGGSQGASDEQAQASKEGSFGQDADLFSESENENDNDNELFSENAAQGAIAWQRPQEEGGPTPAWLGEEQSAIEGREKNRAALSQPIEFDFNGTPLQQVVQWLSDQTNIEFELNTHQLEASGVSAVDSAVTVTGSGSVREFLRRMGEPLELTYVIHESTIEITTRNDAFTKPSLRNYDLSFVLPNSANAAALMLAIQKSVSPEHWQSNGSSMVLVGSMLIVRAAEATHQEIEMVLQQLAKMNPANATPNNWPDVHHGVMGGGMGGGGMGGMGGGGMGGGMGGMSGGMF